ncbi:MAG TPA: hypothetical protein VN285_12600 [Candidatus Deferrimicrobium sp.]|nr:hypothetical protein [Candidatus Deferrimicrobium sp.]
MIRLISTLLIVLCAADTVGANAAKVLPIESLFRAQLAGDGRMESFAADKDFDFARPAKDTAVKAPERAAKSVVGAAWRSAVLPGWGEFYVGHKRKARVFFTVEGLAWIGFFGFRTYGNWKEDDFIRFAAQRAGADLDGKDDWFLDVVGFYDDIDDYNALGRAYDPERPYLEDNATYHWRWQQPADRDIYRNLKNQSREAFRRANFMIGLALVNRVVSVIDAVRDARRSRRTLDDSFDDPQKSRWRFRVDPFSRDRQLILTYGAAF